MTWQELVASGRTLVFYCHACLRDTPYASEPRCEHCGCDEGQITGFNVRGDADRLAELLDAIADAQRRDPVLRRLSRAWDDLFEKANEIAQEVGHAR